MLRTWSKYIGWVIILHSALHLPLTGAIAAEVCDPKTVAAQPPVLQTVPKECKVENWSDVANFVRQKVILMKVSASKADFKNLSIYRQELESVLKLCSGDSKDKDKGNAAPQLLHKVCDTECTVQRASAALFNVSELPYLDSSGTVMKVASANIIEEAKDGIKIVDEALNHLANGNRGGQDLDDKKPSAAFNQFLQDNARLQSVKARLLMSLGDSFYKNVSRSRATSIKKRVENALQVAEVKPHNPGKETDFAEVYYEQASWVIQEALVDIPLINSDGTAGNSNGQTMVADFGRLRREMDSLQLDVEQRLGSIRKGFLFLNIDPESFSTLTSDALQTLLQNQLKELDDIEDRISQIVVAWQDKKSDEARRQIDARNLRDEHALEIKGMQIASYEDFATELTHKFQNLIALNGYATAMQDGKVELLEKQSMLANLRFEVAKLQVEAKHQIEVINSQSQLDLTILAREQHQEQRDQYKWLVDATLTTLNLELQKNEYLSQIKDFEDQIRVKGTDKASVESQVRSKKALMAAEENKIKEHQAMIDKLNKQKTEVLEANLMPLRFQVCALAQEHAKYLGRAPNTGDVACAVVTPSVAGPDHWVKVLDLRATYFGADGNGGLIQQNYIKIRNCMSGGDCEGLSSIKVLIQQTYDFEKKLVEDTQSKQIELMQDKLQEIINHLTVTQVGANSLKGALAAINGGLGAVYIALAGKVIGVPPSFDVGEQAKAGYDIAMSAAEKAVDIYESVAQYEHEKDNIRVQIMALTKELETAKAMLSIQEVAKNRAMAELVGRRLELEKENLLVKADASAAILDAKFAQAQLEAEGPRIQAEINEALARMKALSIESNLLNYELSAFASQIAAAREQISALDFEIEGLGANIRGIDMDIDRISHLKDNAAAQRDLVATTQVKVNSLNDQVAFENSVIEDLYSQQEKNLTSLSRKQIEQIEAVFKLNETQIQSAIGFVEKTIQENIVKLGLIEEGKALTTSMNQQLQQIYGQVKAKRCEMLQYAASRPEPGAEAGKLFLASEEIIANLTQGVPEYIRSKKNRLDYVNYLYNLYRNRVTLLSDIAGNDIEKSYSYIQTGKDLREVMKDFCVRNSNTNPGSWICSRKSIMFDKRHIPVLAHAFTIPSDSGLMSRLLSKGQARFEITPAALQGVQSFDPNTVSATLANNGFFQLWDGSMSSIHNMSLVSLSLHADMVKDCNNKVTLNVRHLGYGARYLPVSADGEGGAYPVLSVTAPRYAPQIVWGSGQTPNFEHYFQGLVNNHEISGFPEAIKDHGGAVEEKHSLQFLGAPLVGTYEIAIDAKDPWVASCLIGRSLNIGIAFTKPSINQ